MLKETVGNYRINAFPAELETPAGKFTLSQSAYYGEITLKQRKLYEALGVDTPS
jgi:hypothetical protein